MTYNDNNEEFTPDNGQVTSNEEENEFLSFNVNSDPVIPEGPQDISNSSIVEQQDTLEINEDLEPENQVEGEDPDNLEDDPDEEGLQNETLDEQNLESYSNSAILAKALEQEGLDLFGEDFSPELKASDLVTNIKEFINNEARSKAQEVAERYEGYAKYFEFIDRGGDENDLIPAIKNKKYADFDPDAPDVTESQLEEHVKAMYIKKGADEQTAMDMVEVDRQKNRLLERSKLSSEFHKQYINHIEQRAAEKFKLEAEEAERLEKQEMETFSKVLGSEDIYGLPIDQDVAKRIFNNMYKRDQVASYTDENGNKKQELLTGYEIGMYNAINDPKKLAFLNYLILSDFNLSEFKVISKMKGNADLTDILDNRGKKSSRNSSNSKSREILTEIEI